MDKTKSDDADRPRRPAAEASSRQGGPVVHVCDDAVDRAGLAALFAQYLPDISLSAAASVDDARHRVPAGAAGALVLCADEVLRVGGVGLVHALKLQNADVRVAVYGALTESEAGEWARAGVDGILSRRLEPARLAAAIRFLLAGNRYASPEIFDRPTGAAGLCAFLGTCGRYFPLLDELPLLLMLVQEGRVAYANRQAVRALGLSEATLLNRPFANLVAADRRPEVDAALAKAATEGTLPPRLLLPLSRGDGAIRWVEAQWHATELAGRPALSCVGLDVTEHLEAAATPDRPVSEHLSHAYRRLAAEAEAETASAGGDEERFRHLATLTRRQREVLARLAVGASNKEIATRLGITEATVKLHVHHILRSLQLNNRTEAALVARRLLSATG